MSDAELNKLPMSWLEANVATIIAKFFFDEMK